MMTRKDFILLAEIMTEMHVKSITHFWDVVPYLSSRLEDNYPLFDEDRWIKFIERKTINELKKRWSGTK